jgi:hypothetical protein
MLWILRNLRIRFKCGDVEYKTEPVFFESGDWCITSNKP